MPWTRHWPKMTPRFRPSWKRLRRFRQTLQCFDSAKASAPLPLQLPKLKRPPLPQPPAKFIRHSLLLQPQPRLVADAVALEAQSRVVELAVGAVLAAAFPSWQSVMAGVTAPLIPPAFRPTPAAIHFVRESSASSTK